ncbi:MAG: GNAT family N-acetyltransferase [Caldilineaceae bacterium]
MPSLSLLDKPLGQQHDLRTFILETARLTLHEFTADDAPHILGLLNTPGWLQYIGDRNIHTLAEAAQLIERTYQQKLRDHGFGFWAVYRKTDARFIGMCGFGGGQICPMLILVCMRCCRLIAIRDTHEAAQATLDYAKTVLQIPKIIGVCDPQNIASRNLLQKLGMVLEKEIQWSDGSPTLLFS